MGLRGPAGRSDEEKAIRGNPGKRKLNLPEQGAQAPATGDDVVEILPPDWLIKEALEVWDRLKPDLVRMKTLTFLDVDLFGKYCQLIGTAIKCERVIAKKGAHVKHKNNTFSPRPEVKLAKESWAQAEKLAGHFGLSPKVRKAMNLTVPPRSMSDADRAEQEANNLLNGCRE